MSSKFLLVVPGMGADPFHHYQAAHIAHLDHQSIAIALDVENHPVFGQKIGTAVPLLYVLRCLPVAKLDFVSPCVQWTPGIRVRTLELFKK